MGRQAKRRASRRFSYKHKVGELAKALYARMGRGAVVCEKGYTFWYSPCLSDVIGDHIIATYDPETNFVITNVGDGLTVTRVLSVDHDLCVDSRLNFDETVGFIVPHFKDLAAQAIHRWSLST